MKKKINWNHPIFLKIYNDNNGRCMITRKFILYESVTKWNFHHIKPKGKYPELMYDEKNIVFCTMKIHMDLESMTKDKYNKLIKRYPKLVLYFNISKLK